LYKLLVTIIICSFKLEHSLKKLKELPASVHWH